MARSGLVPRASQYSLPTHDAASLAPMYGTRSEGSLGYFASEGSQGVEIAASGRPFVKRFSYASTVNVAYFAWCTNRCV